MEEIGKRVIGLLEDNKSKKKRIDTVYELLGILMIQF